MRRHGYAFRHRPKRGPIGPADGWKTTNDCALGYVRSSVRASGAFFFTDSMPFSAPDFET